MDINKENNLGEESVSKAEELETEAYDFEIELEEETTPLADETEDTEEDDSSTVSVSMEDIDEELMRYGITADEESEEYEDFDEFEDEPEKERKIQKPILIAALSFLLTAVVIFGTYFVYGIFAPKGIEGTWVQEGSTDNSLFLKFDEGTVTMSVGGYQRYGYYEIEEVNGYDILKTDFYELVVIGSNIAVSYSEDDKTMTLHFLYDGVDLSTFDVQSVGIESLEMGSISFVRGKAPKAVVDADNITHASADELGITAVNIDENILGSWRLSIEGAEGKYNTFTFNDDGTGSHDIDYIFYEIYGCGLGEKSQFKYTVYEDSILVTTTYYDGTTSDQIYNYYVDNGNLVLDGVGYEKVK